MPTQDLEKTNFGILLSIKKFEMFSASSIAEFAISRLFSVKCRFNRMEELLAFERLLINTEHIVRSK